MFDVFPLPDQFFVGCFFLFILLTSGGWRFHLTLLVRAPLSFHCLADCFLDDVKIM